VILDLDKFIESETPYWRELERMVEQIESVPGVRLPIGDISRLHYLYQRASADLARVKTFAAAPEVREYLEALVARAYAAVHERRRPVRFPNPFRWFVQHFPRTVRSHAAAFLISAVTLWTGAGFGAGMVLLDPSSHTLVLPRWIRAESPTERVAREHRLAENSEKDPLKGIKATFAAGLLANNVRVSLLAFGLGVTFGLGTLGVLFFNGLMLGGVAAWYAADGQTRFLLGWLLPHGVVELTAVMLAGQAGLMLADALLGRGRPIPLHARVRGALPNVLTVIAGTCILLVWAAGVEAFISQYHEPVLPYSLKIGIGVAELIVLALFFGLAGRSAPRTRT